MELMLNKPNKKPSILVVRRFEKWVAGLFALAALMTAVSQALQSDYWAAGIFFLTFLLSGVIGQGFSYNLKRSARELTQGFSSNPKSAAETEISDEELDNLVTAEKRFGLLWSATIVALLVHYSVSWWKIVVAVLGVWILLIVMTAVLGAISKKR